MSTEVSRQPRIFVVTPLGYVLYVLYIGVICLHIVLFLNVCVLQCALSRCESFPFSSDTCTDSRAILSEMVYSKFDILM